MADETQINIPQQKKTVRDLKKERTVLRMRYLRARNAIKDKKREELEDLRDNYKLERLKVEKPLKAEAYALKIAKKKEHRRVNEPPKRRLLEEIGNAVTHGVGAIAAIVLGVFMIMKAQGPLALTAAIVYSVCFFLQMLFSCLYHSFRHGTRVKRLFRRFDYSAIYLAIGGTFAPIYLIYMVDKMWGFSWGVSLFAIQWALIATGITFVAVFGPGRIRWLHYTLFFAIGWSAIMFIPHWIQYDLPLFVWILSGGLTYTLGMIPFAALRGKPVAHFIWHFFVLAASVLMWVGIYLYIF